jgi:hypothetical protein
MGYLDNLESSLKSLESQEERDGAQQNRREADRALALGVAPWADKLKSSQFTQKLFEEAAVTGHRLRAKIYVAWLDRNLRLELRGHYVELRPSPTGILAHYFSPDGAEGPVDRLDLSGSPKTFLDKWIASQSLPSPVAAQEQIS